MYFMKNLIIIMKFLWGKPMSLNELSVKTGLFSSFLTDKIELLQEKGFVLKKRVGKSILITGLSNEKNQNLRKLVLRIPNISDIVENETILTILGSLLKDSKTSKEILLQTSLSGQTLKKYLPILKNRGIIIKRKKEYVFNKNFWLDLYEYLSSLQFSNLNGILLFKKGNEELIETEKNYNLDNAIKTGFSVFKDYGIIIHTSKEYYFVPKKSFSGYDIFIHGLYCIKDVRGIAFCIAFYKKNKLSFEKAYNKALEYDAKSMFLEIMNIINSKEEKINTKIGIVSRKDITEILTDYGVKL